MPTVNSEISQLRALFVRAAVVRKEWTTALHFLARQQLDRGIFQRDVAKLFNVSRHKIAELARKKTPVDEHTKEEFFELSKKLDDLVQQREALLTKFVAAHTKNGLSSYRISTLLELDRRTIERHMPTGLPPVEKAALPDRFYKPIWAEEPQNA